MKNLSVPYKSQWDADAGKTANDCGPASIAMILNYYGENLTTDKVFDKTEAGKGLIGIAQMEKAIKSFGYETERFTRSTPEKLKSFIDRDIPVIALVKYGSLNSVQDKSFKGGHFFAVVGYREDGYFVNDPNFKGDLREHGNHHFFTKSEFEKAWADAAKDGNQPNSFQVIYRRKVNMSENKELETCLVDRKKFWEERDEVREQLKLKTAELETCNRSKSQITGERDRLKDIKNEVVRLTGKDIDKAEDDVANALNHYYVTERNKEIDLEQKEKALVAPKKATTEAAKEPVRIALSMIVGFAVTTLYTKYPFLGQIEPDQQVVIAAGVGIATRTVNELIHNYGKNIGNDLLKTGFLDISIITYLRKRLTSELK